MDQMNGSLSVGDGIDGSHGVNLDVEFRTHTFGGTPDTEENIAHTLGRTPVGFVVLSRDRACHVYDSDKGNWTDVLAKLKCDVADAVINIMFL
jgi:hypothetical protein